MLKDVLGGGCRRINANGELLFTVKPLARVIPDRRARPAAPRSVGTRKQQEETMAEDNISWRDRFRQFGGDLGLPKVEVEQLIESHRKNLDALGHSTQVAAEGAKSLATKQLEIVETAFRETAALVRDFKPTGDPKAVLARQTAFAKKAFNSVAQNILEVSELATRTTIDATATIRNRLRESLREFGIDGGGAGG
jgi:phasin family protein